MEKNDKSGKKTYSAAEKQAIIKEAKANGVKITLEKHGVYPATYYYWKKRLDAEGPDGLSRRKQKERTARIKELEKENRELKLLLAEKELESRLKNELLKKKYPELIGKI